MISANHVAFFLLVRHSFRTRLVVVHMTRACLEANALLNYTDRKRFFNNLSFTYLSLRIMSLFTDNVRRNATLGTICGRSVGGCFELTQCHNSRNIRRRSTCRRTHRPTHIAYVEGFRSFIRDQTLKDENYMQEYMHLHKPRSPCLRYPR
jgi:hypothetical protein